MLRKSQPSISHGYVFYIKIGQFIASGRKRLASFFTRAFLLACVIAPVSVNAQEAGCMDSEILYVKINTIPPAIMATAANFTNCSSGIYTYQWQVSTDNVHYTDLPGATSQNLNYTQPLTETLYFLRKATCGNLTKYTNSVTVYPVYTVCEDFGLSLAGTSGNAVATIKAGLVTTTTSSTVGEFVIDWYREVVDGTPEFTSGSAGATDAAVTVSHPFEGEPAEGGTWHPVIKYVYIDGIKYSREAMTGARHSPDLMHCLDPIVVIVDNLTCSNGGNVSYNNIPYAHKISYRNNINSPALASRSFRFDLDATNKYFAWNFGGYQIADDIKITYVSPSNGNTETVLEYWKVGSSAGNLDMSSSPKTTFFHYEAKITSLTGFTYVAGDYLRIEITSNANANTDWDFYCKCISSPTCEVPTGAVRNITPGSVSMSYDAINCKYEVQYTLTNPYAGGYNSEFWQYHSIQNYQGYLGGVSGSESATIRKLQMQKRTDGNYDGTSFYAQGSCTAMSGSAQVSKAGNIVTLVFLNSADYDSYKTNYNAALANANVSNYSSDPALINYYKFWLIDIAIGNSCGDALTSYQIWSHISNPITFDDGTLTITTTIAPITTNAYVPANSCDFIGQLATQMAGSNNFYAGSNANFSGTTYVKGGIQCYYLYPLIRDETDKRFKLWYMTPGADICDLSSKGWNTPTGNSSWQWELVYVNERVVITDSNDPINNFRLERWMDASGNELASNPIVVYEIVNGVVTVDTGFPVP